VAYETNTLPIVCQRNLCSGGRVPARADLTYSVAKRIDCPQNCGTVHYQCTHSSKLKSHTNENINSLLV
jgi:hypothetical protein